jgi:transcriptional antiterminator RfaH
VSHLVTFGKQPIAVGDELIAQLRQQLSEKPPEPLTLERGDLVRINSGSFKELEAIFLARDGAERIVILLHLLHRKHTRSVPIGTIEKNG